ncbi:hypothetical protein [Micromonospora olivasterospora]|uniref:Uncharacterized protein n=1 Tax=Micromonospora olivasterospora TaxID=1880 RepID=A0A562I8Z3_MICOL|nr:hypothetical protein [Micromonospora olivasterospora]TWH67195.1 hypothetical protein JD77_02167 [Micromonospora olivasterospora]
MVKAGFMQRLPAMDDSHLLVGMIGEVDLAIRLGNTGVAQYGGRICSAPLNL